VDSLICYYRSGGGKINNSISIIPIYNTIVNT